MSGTLPGWGYRKKHWINGVTTAQGLYAVPFTINAGSGSDSGGSINLNNHAETFPSDLRFTKNDGTVELDYWIEKSDVNKATIWVELHTIPTSGNSVDIYIYYGKDTISASDGEDTFVFFDDFLGSSLSADWNIQGTPIVSNSEVSLNQDDSIYSSSTFGLNYSVIAKVKADEQDTMFLLWQNGFGTGPVGDYLHVYNSDYNEPDDFDRFYCRNRMSGTITTSNVDGQLDFRNTYYQYEINRITDKAKFYQNGNLMTTHTTNVPSVSLGVGFCVWDSTQESTLTADWVLVRKYCDPEPNHGETEDEESLLGPEIISNITSFKFNAYNLASKSYTSLFSILLPLVSKTLSSLYHSWKSIYSEFSENLDKFDVRDYISRVLTGIHKLKSLISKSIDSRYLLLQNISKNLSSLWTSLKHASKSVISGFNVQNMVSRVLYLPYSLKTVISKSISIIYSYLTGIVKTLSLSWNNIKYISKSISSLFTTKNIVNRLVDLKYDVQSLISNTLTIVYSYFGWISKELSPSWKIFKFISQSITSKFNIFNLVSKVINFKYFLKNLISRILSLSYQVGGVVSKSLKVTWKLMSYISKEIISQYILKTLISKSIDLTHSLKGFISKSLGSIYSVFNKVSNSLQAIWNNLALISKTIVSKFSIRSFISRSISSVHSIFTKISKQISSQYLIKTLVSRVVSLVYSMIGVVSKTLKVLYDILSKVFGITQVYPTPVRIHRTGIEASILTCEFYDPAKLDPSAYTCKFWLRDPQDNTIGPYSGSVSSIGVGEYKGEYSFDPADTINLGYYDIEAEVIK